MIDYIKDMFNKHYEAISYLFFGGVTTVINFLCYFFFTRVLGLDLLLSNSISWFISVISAFFTNKIFVFRSKSSSFSNFISEMVKFFAGRIVSGVMDIGLFALCVHVLGINDAISKIFINVLVVILNYIISKFFIFNKKGE